MTVGVRHLRAFVAVAEARSITRAAAGMHISQPALSRTLQELERHLGAPLLRRSTRRLELTEAGRSLLGRATALVAELDDLLAPADQPRSPLRLGHAWAALGARTAEVLRAWQEAHPDRPVELRRIDERLVGLRDRRADVAIVRGRPPVDGLEVRSLFDEDRLAVLPHDHPLAARASLVLADLVDEVLVVNEISGTTDPALWADAGLAAPTRSARVPNTDDWASAIAAGVGIGVTTEGTRAMYAHPGLVYAPVVDAPPVPVSLAWFAPAPPGALELADFLADRFPDGDRGVAGAAD